jgi:hypothetical protein
MTIFRNHVGHLVVAAALAALGATLSGCAGQTYQCGTGSANHCYGTVSWTGSPTGFEMELTAVPLTSGDIFVDDEGWLIDYFGSDMSWVETGEENVNPAYVDGFGVTYYFWAYGWHYNSTGTFMAYPLGPVSQSDLNNATWIAYKVSQDANEPSQWNVAISKASSGTPLYSGTCSTCSMTPNTVLEGQELSGSSAAEAPLAFFAENAVITGSKTTYRTDDGTVTSDDPPTANWWPPSKPSQTSNGGLFFTWCC